HGTTYGGNLLACRAAIVVLEQLANGTLIDHVRTVGAHLDARLAALAAKHAVIVEVRGAGLMRGIVLRVDALPVVDAARDRGLLVNRTDETVVRMLPALTVGRDDLDKAVDILDAIFTELGAA
ncbi:MAG: aminotransferase class III-fold pyridoxal phosphate-dependent enzyme, partial [Vicinamibacterales bacterium]